MAEPAPRENKRRHAAARGAARMAAVQALYQIAVTELTAEAVLDEFVRFRLKDDKAGDGDAPDRALFADIVRGVIGNKQQLDEMISSALVEGWTIERMDRVLHAIVRAGAYELLSRRDVPPRVAITQYVDVAHAFFDGREPGFVNGILDRLAHILRSDEIDGSPSAEGAKPRRQ